ncbi:hypothetical protein OS493_031804 [Desmophyllum pertusum]|uniref:Fibrillar collagen NC1 domain-containing protein n=1 Tax=Desmophyllum pertusum TaxID=174260 RepID=A0A9W9YW94_9CNID|nr:hypothetical protein OS493_031804 [Desmophyllum pertusum]
MERTGPSGPKGVVGHQGMPGPQGYSGEEGMIGPQGDHGNHGERGRVGEEGLPGDAGPPGPPGEQIHGSQLQNKGPGFRLYSTKEGESSAELNYLRGLGNVIYFYKSQHGTRLSPARSCRELYLEHPDYPSGNYWIDPNEGCVSDAEHVYCDFEIGASCVFPKNKEVKDPNARPFQWMSERISDAETMRYLRLLSRSVSQNITYNCYNSRAWEDEGRTIKLQGDNEMELTSFEKTKPVVLKNECKAADNKWHQTVLEFNTT